MSKTVSSIFNNVIGPVMRGPSSSHTAASVRIGRLAVNLLGEKPVKVVLRFDPSGSLASTYRGQGSAMGIAAGLLGLEMTDPDIIKAEEICRSKGVTIEYIIDKPSDPHPNTYNIVVTAASGKEVAFTAISTGGGIVRLVMLNGKEVDDDLDYINPLMPVTLLRNPNLPFGSIDEMEVGDASLSDMAIAYESAISGLSGDDIFSMAISHSSIIKNSIENGMAGTDYNDRILHRQSHLLSRQPEQGTLIPAGLTNRIIESVTAIMETKSSMGVIVAAPTAGSSGTIGGVLMPVAGITGKTENDIARALLAGGLVGLFITHEGGFAAEEGGCQYECGAASGMAAAALVELMGGDAAMAMNAASMAMQNTMGMICDPVANRVEVPCLGKNIMASLNALASANMIIAGFDHVVPLKEVIIAMKEVGTNMDRRFRCTCGGGLSVTPASLRITGKLKKAEDDDKR